MSPILPTGFLGPIGPWEAALVLLVGLLLFGKRLPEVGKQLGRTVVELRRKFQDFKRDLNQQAGLQDARSAVDQLRRDLERPVDTVRSLQDPVQVFEHLTREDRATPGPGTAVDKPPAGSFLTVLDDGKPGAD